MYEISVKSVYSVVPDKIAWRTPNIYQQIMAAGEQVVGVAVIQVNANGISPGPVNVNNNNWTLSGSAHLQ